MTKMEIPSGRRYHRIELTGDLKGVTAVRVHTREVVRVTDVARLLLWALGMAAAGFFIGMNIAALNL